MFEVRETNQLCKSDVPTRLPYAFTGSQSICYMQFYQRLVDVYSFLTSIVICQHNLYIVHTDGKIWFTFLRDQMSCLAFTVSFQISVNGTLRRLHSPWWTVRFGICINLSLNPVISSFLPSKRMIQKKSIRSVDIYFLCFHSFNIRCFTFDGKRCDCFVSGILHLLELV